MSYSFNIFNFEVTLSHEWGGDWLEELPSKLFPAQKKLSLDLLQVSGNEGFLDEVYPSSRRRKIHGGVLEWDASFSSFKLYSYSEKTPILLFYQVLIAWIRWFGIAYGHMIIHGAGLREKGRGLLIPGRQERGKTTLAQLFPKENLLHDDLILLVQDKTLNRFFMFGPPDLDVFSQEGKFGWCGGESLEKIIYLRRGGAFSWCLLNSLNSYSMMEEEGPFFVTGEEPFLSLEEKESHYNDLMGCLLNKYPAYSLTYNPKLDQKETKKHVLE